MISRSFCWSIMKKMTKKWDLETSNVETKLKIGIYAKNWVKQVLLKNFNYGQSQRSTVRVNGQSQRSESMVKVNGQQMTCADVVVWHHLRLTWQEAKRSRHVGRMSERGTGAWGAWQILTARGDAWSACSWGRNFSRRVEARVMQFLAVLSWVLLGIGCSVFLCLFFDSWMRRTLISECCRYYGRNGGGSLLTVITGWRWGQRKNAGDVHKNQKVRGMALIPC